MIELQRRESLEDRIDAGTAGVAVVGLGSAGLPLAAAFGRAGFRVLGIDGEESRVARLRAGRSDVDDVPSVEVARLLEGGRLEVTSDAARLGAADAILLCVPTPCTRMKEPDLSYLLAAAADVRRFLRRGHLVILASSTYPGSTEEVVRPLLEAGGLQCGEEFELAYAPERVDPGNRRFTVRNTPQIVGGVTPRAAELAAALYSHVTERVVRVSTPRAAEMTKLMENSFRHVNIALANEMADLCGRMGIDIWEVIDAAATKPFGFMPFYPGPGAGGRGIPVDPCYLAWKAREMGECARFIELASQVNDGMPKLVVERVADALNERGKSVRGSHILVLGVSYKKDTSDWRESPALKVIDRLQGRGAVVIYHDAHVPSVRSGAGTLVSTTLTPAVVRAADCALILTDHSDLARDMLLEHAQVIVDTRNALRGIGGGKVVRR